MRTSKNYLKQGEACRAVSPAASSPVKRRDQEAIGGRKTRLEGRAGGRRFAGTAHACERRFVVVPAVCEITVGT